MGRLASFSSLVKSKVVNSAEACNVLVHGGDHDRWTLGCAAGLCV